MERNGFGMAKMNLANMADMYGQLDGGNPSGVQKPKAAPSRGNITKPGVGSKVITGTRVGGAISKPIGGGVSKVPTGGVSKPSFGASKTTLSKPGLSKPMASRTDIKSKSSSATFQATLSGKMIAHFFEKLFHTFDGSASLSDSILTSKSVASKTGLRLFDFTAGQTGPETIDDQIIQNGQDQLIPMSSVTPKSELSYGIVPGNLVQGRVGDCYILGSLSVLAGNPQNISRLVEDKGDFVEVWLCDSGCWKKIKVSKTVPGYNGKPFFASPKEGGIWQMVLEKAFACLYKGYERLELGHSSTSLRELTGCGTEYIELDKPEEAWNKLKEFLSAGFLITASSKVEGLSSNAITPKHCYAVLAAKEVTDKGKNYRFVRLNNPMGMHSSAPQLPASLAQKLGGNPHEAFWYQYGSVLKDFEVMTCCKVDPNLCYSWYRVSNPGQKKSLGMYKVCGKQGDSLEVTLNHKNLRHYMQQNLEMIRKTKYGVTRMVGFRMVNGKVEVLGYSFHSLQTCSFEVKLTNFSEFYVFVDIDFKQQCLDEFTVGVSSTHPAGIFKEEASERFLEDDQNRWTLVRSLIHEIAMRGDTMQFKKNSIHPIKLDLHEYKSKSRGIIKELKRYYGQALGYVAFTYSNLTGDVRLKETLIPAELKNVTEFWPIGAKISGMCIELPPGAAEVILLKFGPENNCSHVSRIQSNSELLFD